MNRSKLISFMTFIVLVFCLIYVYNQSGYSISETKALEKSFPNDNGIIVNKQKFNNFEIVMCKGQNEAYAKLVYEKWNFLYQVKSASVLSSAYPDKTIKRTWTAT